MQGRVKLVIAATVWVCLCFLALAFWASWYANSDKAGELLLREINARIPGEIAFSHHHISLLNGSIRIQNLRISAPDGRDLAGAESFFIDLSIASILKKALIVETVDLRRPWVRLDLDNAGRLNILDVFTAEDATPPATTSFNDPMPLNLVCNHFRLSEGALQFSDADGGKRLSLENVEMDASGNLHQKSAVLNLNIGKARMALDGYLSEFKRLNLALALNKGNIEPVVINGENQFASLLLYGDVRRVFSEPELDLNLKIVSSVEGVESFFNTHRKDKGRVSLSFGIMGAPANPQVDMIARFGPGSLAGYRIGRMDGRLRLADRIITLESLSADTDIGRLAVQGKADLRGVFPADFLGPAANWQKLSYTGRVGMTDVKLAALAPAGVDLHGSLNFLLDVEGAGIKGETLHAAAAADLSVRHFRLKGLSRAVDIRATSVLELQDGKLKLKGLEARAAGARASAGGSLDWKAQQVDARFTIDDEKIATLLSLFGLTGISGDVALQGSLQGKMTNPAFKGTAVGKGLSIMGADLGNVRLKAGLTEAGRLEIASLVMKNRGSALKAEGHVQLFESPYRLHHEMPVEGHIVFSGLEWSDVMPGNGIMGSARGELFVSGSLKNPAARADVSVESVAYGNVRLGNLAGKMRWHDGSLVLDRVHLKNGRTSVTARGELNLLQRGTWNAVETPDFRLILSDGRVYLQDFDEKVSGELLLEADIGGRLTEPAGDIHVSGRDIDLGLQRITSLEMKVRSGNRQIVVEPFTLNLPEGGRIAGSGKIGYDQSYQFELSARDLPAGSIDRLRDLEEVSGKLNLRFSGKGRLGMPEMNGSAEWSELSVRGEKIDDVFMQFSVKDSLVSLKGRQSFELDAGYDLSSKDFSIDLVMGNTRLAPWFAIAARPAFGGSVSGSIRAEGNLDDVANTRAEVDIERLALTFHGEHFAGSEGIRGTLSKRVFDIPEFRVSLPDQGHLAVEGKGSLAGDIALKANGNIPLKAANLLASDLPVIDGSMFLATSVGGSFQHPEFSGEIRIEQAGMEIPDLRQTLHSVEGRMVLAKNNDIAGSIGGMLDDGRFEISMRVEMDGFVPKRIDARGTATAIPIQLPDTMDLLISADLSMAGVPEDLLLKGDVVMLEGTYYKDFNLNFLESVQEKSREETPRPVQPVHPLLRPLRFDIHFKHRQPLVVSNNIAELEISPDLVLTGTADNPVVTGAATVDTGSVTYHNRSFVVQRGSVDFINPYKTEAEIDIKGQVEIREWVITISLTGPPDRLAVELSSSPPEEDADIISLLVFKKTTYELNEGGPGVNQSPTVLLAQLLASSFGRDIKDSTGIDILEVEAESAEDKDSTDRIKVTVGKDLSERMSVKYSVESKDGGYVQRASTEYKLLENIVVSGFQDTKGVYGGEFIFRMEFRLFR
ncbi:MAG: translocation/assembly module TamB domain-containing protein [Deltaproteobacteria bacterium]|nr:translocation/assembly module TamB domain-containing protein [Deltaproteobacteria bacterium]